MTRPTFVAPDTRYHPGVNARPTGGPVLDIAHSAATATSLGAPAVQTAWHYGLFLIDRGYFWEAHEVLEPVWMVALPNSQERHLVQGLIQLANACLKSEMGRAGAAARLVEMAWSHLAEARNGDCAAVLGVSIQGCVSQAEEVRDSILAGRSPTGVLKLEAIKNAL